MQALYKGWKLVVARERSEMEALGVGKSEMGNVEWVEKMKRGRLKME